MKNYRLNSLAAGYLARVASLLLLLFALTGSPAQALSEFQQDTVSYTFGPTTYVATFAVGNNGHLQYTLMNTSFVNSQWPWYDLGKPAGVNWITDVKAVTYKDSSGHQRFYVFTRVPANGVQFAALAMCFFDGFKWDWVVSGNLTGKSIAGFSPITYPDTNGKQVVDVFVVSAKSLFLYSCADCNGFNGAWSTRPNPYGDFQGYKHVSAVTYLDTPSRRRIHVFGVLDWGINDTLPTVGVYSYSYDGLGNWTWLEHPHNGQWSFSYPGAINAITFKDHNGARHVDVFTMTGYKLAWSGGASYGIWIPHIAPSTYQGSAQTFVAPYAPTPVAYADASGYTHVYDFMAVYGANVYENPWNIVVNWTYATESRSGSSDGAWSWLNMTQFVGAPETFPPSAVTFFDTTSNQQMIYVFALNRAVGATGNSMTLIYWNGSSWNWKDLGTGV